MQTSQYHIFSLPAELLESLTPRNLVNRVPTRPPSPDLVVPASKSGPRACAVCQGKIFLDVDEQRAHFRSDWHRYNVKTRLTGGQSISEAAFSQLLEGTQIRLINRRSLIPDVGLDDSLSGSASSSDDEDDDEDAVNTLVNKTKRLNTRSSSPESASKNPPITALTWFHSPPSTQIGIYRSILPLKTTPESYLNELRRLQPSPPEGRTWAMFMVAGGHFAGAIVRVSRGEDDDEEDEKSRKKRAKKPKPETEVLLHKTFHRYTSKPSTRNLYVMTN